MSDAPDLPVLMQRLAVYTAIRDAANGQLKDDVRPAVQKALEEAHSASGADRFKVRVGGSHIANVTRSETEAKVVATISDEQALLDWVAAEHPDQIRRTVEEGFLQRLLTRAVHGGEIIPGVELDEQPGGKAGLRLTFTSGGRDTIGTLLAGGENLELLPSMAGDDQ